MTNVSRPESPRRDSRNKSDGGGAAAQGGRRPRGTSYGLEPVNGLGSGPEHSFQVHHRGSIIIPLDDQIGPIYTVYKTEYYDAKTTFRTT
ncbi:hypothetical protein F511_38103 [Dorcoceras hygrometricum]|uniref:Uncharacterized protein n=1 Tax=Dorcoceras hygrometricum TaxID=472368 RepID=A0A2Z7AJX1_9LAMI|nr:hypothetical protein F511_38103 [Dorcoceras hygrometricum]